MINWLTDLLFRRGNDLSTHFLPMAYFLKYTILESHQIPLWSSFQFLGQPYLADPQNFIFYLPNYLFVLLPIEPAFLILILVHLILAGIGAYFLAKNQFKLPLIPAIFAALAFALTPKIFSHLEGGHYTMLNALAWLPWFIHLAFRFIDQPSSKSAALLALFAWLIYLNYINIAYFALLFFAAYSLFYFFTRKTKLNFKPYAIGYMLFAILFFGLISPNLLAQLELSDLSTRKLMIFEYVAQPIWSFKLFLQNLLFPYRLTYLQFTTERVLFPGTFIGILALLGLFSWRNKIRWFFIGWIIFSLLFSLGARIPFFIFFYKFFPLMKWMRVTTRLWIISNLLIAIFAGLGLKKIWRQFNPKLTFLIISLSLVELIAVHVKIFSQPTQSELLPDSFYAPLRQDKSYFRTYCTTACFSLRQLGQLNVNSISGNNPVQITSFADYLQSAGGYQYWHYAPILPPYQSYDQQPQPSGTILGKMNVKYVASPYPLIDKSFKLLQQESGFYLYRNLDQQSAWLSQSGQTQIVSFSPNTVKVKVNTDISDNLLTLSQQFYPGWQAVDQTGHRLPIIDAQPFMATKITPATTEITFSYYPHYFTISLILLCASLLSVFILVRWNGEWKFTPKN